MKTCQGNRGRRQGQSSLSAAVSWGLHWSRRGVLQIQIAIPLLPEMLSPHAALKP